MARMSIDDKFLRDPRVVMLAAELGINRYEARGRLLDVFAICYDLETDLLTPAAIDTAADLPRFADAMFAVDLAVNQRGKLRVRGADERIRYLDHKREAGRIGGLNSALSRQLGSKQNPVVARALGNPPDPVPDPPPDPVPDPVPEKREKKRARGKPAASNPREIAVVDRILGRLGEHAGHAYGGAAEHVRLITARIRDGITEAELRAVIAYAADEWKGDPKMARYLRPETLFGPQSIARYLDAARGKYAAEIKAFVPPSDSQPVLQITPPEPRR